VAFLLGGVLLYSGQVIRPYLADRAAGAGSLAALQRAAALDGGNAEYQIRMGNYHAQQRDPDGPTRAADCYVLALRRNPFHSWSWQQLAYLYQRLGNTPAAENALHAAERLSPRSASMAITAANFRLDQDRPREAMQWLRRAI